MTCTIYSQIVWQSVLETRPLSVNYGVLYNCTELYFKSQLSGKNKSDECWKIHVTYQEEGHEINN
jgi:hypothetical protein